MLNRRKDFPMMSYKMNGHDLIYFDNGATAQKPQLVIDAEASFYRDHYSTVHRSVYTLVNETTTWYHEVRSKIRKLINATKDEEIIYTRGTTESINLVASSFGKAFVKPGDEIIISELEHHSNIVPWQIMCQDRGAVLRVIPIDEHGELLLDEYKKLLNEKTKLVAVGHVSNALGTVNPIKEIVELAHSVDAKVLVDGAQSIPHMRVDVQDLDVDFYAFSGHKMYGPTGVGVLYGKEELLEALPPYQGGGDMIENVTLEKTTYAPPPMKFEAGTPMIAQVLGLGAAIDYLLDIGFDKIQEHEHGLLQYATALMESVEGLKIIGKAQNKAAIISFIIYGAHPLDVGTLLSLKGVAIRTGHHCAQPALDHYGLTATARASFGLYNTKEEIDQFVEHLHEVLHQLGRE